MNPHSVGGHDPLHNWDLTLPNKSTLLAKVMITGIIATTMVGLIFYGSAQIYPLLKHKGEAAIGSIPLVIAAIGGYRMQNNGNDLRWGINERTAKLYELPTLMLMFVIYPFLFPVVELKNYVDYTNYSDRTYVNTISSYLQKATFSELSISVIKHPKNLFKYGFIEGTASVPDFSYEGGEIKRGQKNITTQEWMKKALPLMKQLQTEVSEHIKKCGPKERQGEALKITKPLLEAIESLNQLWKTSMVPHCRLGPTLDPQRPSKQNWLEKQLLHSKAPKIDEFDKFLKNHQFSLETEGRLASAQEWTPPFEDLFERTNSLMRTNTIHQRLVFSRG